MAWTLTTDVEEFASAAGQLLESSPERFTVMLTIVDQIRRGVPMNTTFGSWRSTPTSVVTGAFASSQGWPVMLAAVPAESVGDLVAALRSIDPLPTSINGSPDDAIAVFRAATTSPAVAAAVTAAPLMQQRLYRLGDLKPPPGVPGCARVATTEDLDVVAAWLTGFDAESAFGGNAVLDLRRSAELRIDQRLFWLWVVDGVPVSLAGRQQVCAGIARIGPVYTPVENRRHGYGAAVTAACSAAAIEAGATGVVLFTDLANPTSNAIYQTIGYVPVEDRVILSLPVAQ